MKIETLLNLFEMAITIDNNESEDMEISEKRCCSFRKGIIRKFERLEKENFSLRLAYYGDVYTPPVVDGKPSPFVYLKTDK